MSRVALYARVSTHKDQSVETQFMALRDWAAGRGHIVVAEYADEGISGAKGRDKRPALDEMMRAATMGAVDMVAVTALDRLARSLSHLVGLGSELEALHVGMFIANMAFDTSTPTGRLMFNMLGSFAEFERELIRERTMHGLDRARRRGKTLGRPKVPRITEGRIAMLLQAGTSATRTALLAQVGKSVVMRIKKELAACPPSPS
ncbi:MAG: recombinase family protein [Polyangiaceae bacterium]